MVCPTSFANLGLTTCYDLRFPELYTKMAHERDANVMLVPSAFTVPTGRAHWEILLRARAIETQSYVIAAAQVGKHSAKVPYILTIPPALGSLMTLSDVRENPMVMP